MSESTPATAEVQDHAEQATPRWRHLPGWKAFLRDVLLILLIAIMASFLIKTFLVRSFYIPSISMEGTLLVDDRILVNELEPDLIPISHGDVIVFTDPGRWLTAEGTPPTAATPIDWVLSFVGLTAPDSNDHLVKRVIGLPGDTVACCTAVGQLTVNGEPLDEPYLAQPTQPASSEQFEVTVPADSLWVMGDNRAHSSDSRRHTDGPTNGFVPYANVVGRAILVTWPLDRWAWLDNTAN